MHGYYTITIDKNVYENKFEKEIDAYNFALTKYGYIMSNIPISNSVFTVIEIENIVYTIDCNKCGHDYIMGADIKIDDKQVLQLDLSKHCYGGIARDDNYIYDTIIEHLKLPIKVELIEKDLI